MSVLDRFDEVIRRLRRGGEDPDAAVAIKCGAFDVALLAQSLEAIRNECARGPLAVNDARLNGLGSLMLECRAFAETDLGMQIRWLHWHACIVLPLAHALELARDRQAESPTHPALPQVIEILQSMQGAIDERWYPDWKRLQDLKRQLTPVILGPGTDLRRGKLGEWLHWLGSTIWEGPEPPPWELPAGGESVLERIDRVLSHLRAGEADPDVALALGYPRANIATTIRVWEQIRQACATGPQALTEEAVLAWEPNRLPASAAFHETGLAQVMAWLWQHIWFIAAIVQCLKVAQALQDERPYDPRLPWISELLAQLRDAFEQRGYRPGARFEEIRSELVVSLNTTAVSLNRGEFADAFSRLTSWV